MKPTTSVRKWYIMVVALWLFIYVLWFYFMLVCLTAKEKGLTIEEGRMCWPGFLCLLIIIVNNNRRKTKYKYPIWWGVSNDVQTNYTRWCADQCGNRRSTNLLFYSRLAWACCVCVCVCMTNSYPFEKNNKAALNGCCWYSSVNLGPSGRRLNVSC